MNLVGITITGADDNIRIDDLVALSMEFPFVEWGILFSLKRQGREPRYPSWGWLDKLATYLEGEQWPPREYRGDVRFAAHLCGTLADVVMEGDCGWAVGGHTSLSKRAFRRIQINGFSGRLPPPRFASAISYNQGIEVILQATSQTALALAEGYAAGCGLTNLSALFDPSGGRGLRLSDIPCTWKMPMGYAGGIGPDNIVKVIEEVGAANGHTPFWLDMESGVRTDDQLDLAKVRAVLERASPFVKPGAA